MKGERLVQLQELEAIEYVPQLDTIISTLAQDKFEGVLATREHIIYATPRALSLLGIPSGIKPERHPWFKEIFSGTNRVHKTMSGWRGESNLFSHVIGVPLLDASGEVKGAFLYLTAYSNPLNTEVLLSIIQEMNQEENLSTALNLFTRRSLELFGFAASGIYLQEEGKYELLSVSARQQEHTQFLRKRVFPKDFSADGVVLEGEFQPILRNLSELDEEWVLPFIDTGITQLVCMPLIHFGQKIGAIVLLGGLEGSLDKDRYFYMKQVIPLISSFIYEQQLRLASIEREQELTLLLRGTEILVQADSEEQLLTEAGEMAMEILFLPGGFFLLENQEGIAEIRAPFGRLKQMDWDWLTWVRKYIPQESFSCKNKDVHFLDIEDNPFNWERVRIQPLKTHSGLVGELWLMNAREQATEQRQEILAAFVRVVGVALETIRQRDELARLANTDRLTGILNRQGFERRIREEIAGALRRNSSFLLLVLDLDMFKQLNDSLGHPIGDEALKFIAQNLRSAVREEDIVARTGGDEFTVVLTDVQIGEEAVQVIERMKKSMRLEDYNLGVSIGVAEFPAEGRNYNELYRLADKRLYKGKNLGKGNIIST